MRIALIGGTGDIGAGLALRLALLGHEIFVGSRKEEKAVEKCEEYQECVLDVKSDCKFIGMSNKEAAKEGEISVFTIPWKYVFSTAEELRDDLKDKIVVSPIVPMRKESGCFIYCPPESSSAAEKMASVLNRSIVISAFHTIPADKFFDLNADFQWDVPVCGDDEGSKLEVMDLIDQIDGLRPLDAGPLIASRLVESLTPLIVNIMVRNKLKDLGVMFS
ncbi:MAG: NADPH-dependent F420 reductase [Archaeoglobaceae archaeon]